MSTIPFTVGKSRNGGLQTTPETADVLTRNCTLSFTLTDDAAKEYKLTGYTSSDTDNQLGPAKIDGTGNNMTVTDTNNIATTFNICVTAETRSTGQPVDSDPQIRNYPPG